MGKYCVRKGMYKTWKVHFPQCCSAPTEQVTGFFSVHVWTEGILLHQEDTPEKEWNLRESKREIKYNSHKKLMSYLLWYTPSLCKYRLRSRQACFSLFFQVRCIFFVSSLLGQVFRQWFKNTKCAWTIRILKCQQSKLKKQLCKALLNKNSLSHVKKCNWLGVNYQLYCRDHALKHILEEDK